MIPSYFKNEISTIREQMVPLGINGLRWVGLVVIGVWASRTRGSWSPTRASNRSLTLYFAQSNRKEMCKCTQTANFNCVHVFEWRHRLCTIIGPIERKPQYADYTKKANAEHCLGPMLAIVLAQWRPLFRSPEEWNDWNRGWVASP